MSHRVLFFLSIAIIIVGIAGIFFQNTPPEVQEKVKPTAHTILVAKAKKTLKPYDFLTRNDYELSSIEVVKDGKDIRDISSLDNGDLSGYLIRHNISNDSFIFPHMVESPRSPTFAARSLRSNEASYSFNVKKEDEYLLSKFSIGDEISLYLRLVEVDKSKKSNVGFVPEGSNTPDTNLKRYAISKVMGPLSIANIIGSSKEKNKSYSNDDSAGTIVLRLNNQQLSELRVIEKAGELLLFPFDEDDTDQKIRMDEVLPQFNSVKELRGGE